MAEFFPWREAPKADFAVLGDPIDHSRSPQIHHAAYAVHQLDYKYVRIQVSSEEFPRALEHLQTLGYQGVNVTIPHKGLAAEWAANLDEIASAASASNCLNLATLEGRNFDGPGFWATAPAFTNALILGTGGSARSIAAAAEGRPVSVWGRNRSRAESLGLPVVESLELSNFDLVINATSASLSGDALPIEWSEGKGWAVDLLPGQTPFLDQAKAHGWQVQDGLPMLVEQAALSFEWWTGLAAPREAMMEAARR
jgi:shikimate dehydrogenase